MAPVGDRSPVFSVAVVLRAFERRLERLVEGAFAIAFRSGLRPVELGRRLLREMDSGRTVGVGGRPVVPNDYVIRLAPQDATNFADMHDALIAELCEAVREHAREEADHFMAPVRVVLAVEESRRAGTVAVDARIRTPEGRRAPGGLLLPNGQRIELTEQIVRIGRMPDCAVQLTDPNISRYHAEVRPGPEGYVVLDLSSTNGTKVNGTRVTEQVLRDGDQITVGATRIVFQAS